MSHVAFPLAPASKRPRRSRLLGRLLPAVLLLAVVPGAALADEGETKEFADKNFKITLPNERWSFRDVPGDMQSAGYVAQLEAQKGQAFARVLVRVAAADDLPLQELTRETSDGLRQQLSEVTSSKTGTGMLSGIEGSLVLLTGKTGTHDAMFRAYSIEKSGTFHQLIFFLVNGAESTMARELDALRRSYRLLRGAGPVEPEPVEEEAGGGFDEGDIEESDDWPANGPRREGRTLVFPSHNLKWTLPEGSPFEWRSPIPNEEDGEGILIRAVATEEREPADDDDPTENRAVVLLHVRPLPPGYTPQRVVENQGLQESIAENVFEKVTHARTKIVKEIEVGNIQGAALQLVGSREGAVVYFRLYAAMLKEERYHWECVLSGGREVDDVYKTALRDLMKGVEFLDTTQAVRGPIGIAGIPDHGSERGFGEGETKTITSVGFSIKKPPEMREINYTPGQVDPNLRLAWETRSEDGQAYLYFDVQTFDAQALQRANQSEEDLVKARAGQWMEAAQDATTIAKGDEAWFRDRLGRGRGVGYEFRGTLQGAPFVERGYIVKYKKYVYWIRFQYGGEDAEEFFRKLIRTLSKAVKFQ
ncbi:MAG: hypothetical protein ACYTG6_05700 [Planctomycetota bacterium]|jgi:hypothetical protein